MNKSLKERVDENYFTIHEFVNHIGLISYSTACKRIKKGIIPTDIIDNKAYIPRDWVRQNYDEPLTKVLSKVSV